MKQPYRLTANGRYVGALCKGWEIRKFLENEKTSRGNERRLIG
ncbi:hypothetical protein BRE01_31170 [Brevibacillus reuszeri]|uniref:Uncharacterized protein n=1 Tax=Brevibacillus reuszeri TaxID=54915 RepID=A0ABQ0TNG2_9BACL|nr:hypothetical protein BRE01_31170 [Brevibacillus reuszeri]